MLVSHGNSRRVKEANSCYKIVMACWPSGTLVLIVSAVEWSITIFHCPQWLYLAADEYNLLSFDLPFLLLLPVHSYWLRYHFFQKFLPSYSVECSLLSLMTLRHLTQNTEHRTSLFLRVLNVLVAFYLWYILLIFFMFVSCFTLLFFSMKLLFFM